MALTEASIKRVLYYPEQLPDSAVVATAAAPLLAHSEASPTVLDTRQFPPLLLRLSEVLADRLDTVEMRFKVDDKTLAVLTGSLFDPAARPGPINSFSLLAKSRLYYNLYNSSAADINNYKTFFSLWVIKPTVAHKLRYGIPLTPDEQKLNIDLGIAATVEKGLLPLPLAEQISREFQIIQEETHSYQLTVPTAGVDVETLHPQPNEFLILTKMASGPSATVDSTDNIRIAVDRDFVSDYVEFPTWPLGETDAIALDREINCFIPALDELRIKLKATAEPGSAVHIRFTVLKCAMSNIFRARWGLASRDELPKDVWDKVMAGVL